MLCWVQAEPLQRARHVADRVDGDARIERSRIELGVSEQNLDNPNVDVLFEQMRGEAVPQRVRRHALGDSRRLRRGVTGAIELPGRHRVDQPREQPGPWARHPPPVAQQLKQLRFRSSRLNDASAPGAVIRRLPKDRPVNFALPPIKSASDLVKAIEAVAAAVANGELTLSEAGEMSKIVDSFMRAVELTEFEDRLSKLEATRPGS